MWVARTKINGKQHQLGHFADETEAAAAYKKVKTDPSQLEAVRAASRRAAAVRKKAGANAANSVSCPSYNKPPIAVAALVHPGWDQAFQGAR